jgi:hypothetical protein
MHVSVWRMAAWGPMILPRLSGAEPRQRVSAFTF